MSRAKSNSHDPIDSLDRANRAAANIEAAAIMGCCAMDSDAIPSEDAIAAYFALIAEQAAAIKTALDELSAK